MSEPSRRLSAEERREQMLEAATGVFGALGFAGGTTDAVAKAAGISQAYVVRTFGSKDQLHLEVTQRACGRVAATFRDVIASFPEGASEGQRAALMGEAYTALIADRGLLLTLMHAFSAGHDSVIGPAAREGFLTIHRIVRDEAGLGPEAAMQFMAHGMLIDVLLALRLQESPDPDGRALVALACNMDEDHLARLEATLPPAEGSRAGR